MRRAGTESGLLGFCRKLTRDIVQFANPLSPIGSGKSPRDRSIRRRTLQIESLEVRTFLSGASFVATVDPVWFQTVSDAEQSHAGVASWTTQGITSSNNQQNTTTDNSSTTHDWIVQFGSQYVAGMTNIAQTVNLLAGGGFQFEAICGLGIVGEVLIRSTGASLDNIEHWLASDEHVASFEEDAVRQVEATPNDSSAGSLWGMSKIDAYGAWNVTTGATGSNRVVVAVIDTGVDYNHPDLAANIWTNPNAGRDGFGNDLHGYDFANNDANPMDDNGHGTHVAGTIGAVGNNGVGVAGVNWAVSIMPLKFMKGSGQGYLSDAIRAINYATMERTHYGVNVRVINASWGGGGFSAAMQSAITAAGNAGILFVAAAGNNGTNNDVSPQYPSGYNCTNIIAVAATDQNDRLASFSCYGASTVDIAAPGVSIYSTLPNNRYGSLSGTSMATPHVAGAAALAWALDPTATVAEIRSALLQGVDKIGSLSGKLVSGGRLDVLHTLQILQANHPAAPSLGSLVVSVNNVTPGTNVLLTAAGATASSGNPAAIYFYQDSNGNGVFDTSDSYLGADTTVVGGVGTLQINTTNWTPGTYKFFARAADSASRISDAQTASLTVVQPSNNTGGTSSTITSITDGSKLAGKVEAGKAVWYKFQAVAGTNYTIRTELVTLRDSVLYLYDQDGKTQLKMNDDGDSGLASKISWTAAKNGTYYFKVAAFDKNLTGNFRATLAAKATAGASSLTAGDSFAPIADGEASTVDTPNWAAKAAYLHIQQAESMKDWTVANSQHDVGASLNHATSVLENTNAALRSESTVVRMFGQSEPDRMHTLLNEHPALRSVLGSMLLAEDAHAGDAVRSLQIDLDAIDALFAQLSAEELMVK